MKTLFITILLLSMTIIAHAGESFVPLEKGVRMASDDLLYGGKVLSSREAQDLSSLQNIDLSTLEPKSNEIWSPGKSILNDQDAIELQNDETLSFEGALTSNSGLYRFNAIPANGQKIYTIHLDKTLHTLLLRKNILRKLGYKIPAIKYLKKITIEFQSVEERDKFLTKDIPENTLGSFDRWVKNLKIEDLAQNLDLTIDLYDVAVTEPSENDFYNVAMGVPTQTVNSRTLRSLVIPYSIIDLYESVNKFSWIDGKIDNKAAVLGHFTGNSFATTIEDALWMVRKFNLLTRAEIKDAVDKAFFPEEVSRIILEKVISRRNSLNRLFSLKTENLPVDQKLSIDAVVKNGKLLQKDYPGYASRFAYGDAESPFEQLGYFLYAKLDSALIDNFITKFNSKLEAYDLGEARSSFFKKQFSEGLEHFVQTGELRPIGIDTWTKPIANAQLILSRDIILGNYLGTENMVQLADTFGASVDLGVHLGIEGLGYNLSSSVRATTSLVRTFSHIKPVKSLKESVKEPYKNMFVWLLKHNLKEQYLSLSELKNWNPSKEAKAQGVQNILKEIDANLATGESLIMTDRLMPSVDVKLNFNYGLISAGIGAGTSVTVIKRIHIFKKSAKVLQIYEDNGTVTDINLSFHVDEYIPLLRVTGKYSPGQYHIKSYLVNLSSDIDENPNFYTNALGLYNVLKNKNFEILASVIKPVKLDARFVDYSTSLSLLFWKMKWVKGRTYYDIEAKDGIKGNYFSLNKDMLKGVNAEAFSKQIANYYLSDLTQGAAAIPIDSGANPADTLHGFSRSKSIRFEASVNADKKFERKFLSLSETKQGWSASSNKLIRLMNEVNEKFQTPLFNSAQIDFKKMRIYKIGYHFNIYDRGLERLNSIDPMVIDTIDARYKRERGCTETDPQYITAECMGLGSVKADIKRCKKSKSDEDLASCNVTLLNTLLEYLEFKDVKQIIGVDNLYVYGTLDGFRVRSEILNDTIYSNTIGKIGSKEWNGPFEVVRELLGLSQGEFSGSWLREGV